MAVAIVCIVHFTLSCCASAAFLCGWFNITTAINNPSCLVCQTVVHTSNISSWQHWRCDAMMVLLWVCLGR